MNRSARTLAYRYACALLSDCNDSSSLQEVASQLHGLRDTYLHGNHILQQLMNNPIFSDKQRLHLLKLLEQKLGLHANLSRFLQLLVQRDRICYLPQIAVAFAHLRRVQEGTLSAQVTSAHVLSQQQRDQLMQLLQDAFNKQVLLQCKQDSHLLAGTRVYVGGFTFDATLKGRLEALRKQLVV
ncbi:MAG: ATP synthase F1 subunit delta [Myxococcota bacterium]